MAERGAPLGNNNATKNKPWRDALEKELTGNKNAAKLRKLARKMIEEAEEGNMQALKEIGDRLDGKPAQSIEGPGNGGEIVIRVIPDDDGTL